MLRSSKLEICAPRCNRRCSCALNQLSQAAPKLPQKSRNTPAKRKGLLSQGTFGDILDDELRSEAKKAKRENLKADSCIVMLGAPLRGTLRASCLSPNLRERFSSSLALG